jgi:hypothetical protein
VPFGWGPSEVVFIVVAILVLIGLNQIRVPYNRNVRTWGGPKADTPPDEGLATGVARRMAAPPSSGIVLLLVLVLALAGVGSCLGLGR